MPWWKALERMNEIIMFYFDDIVHAVAVLYIFNGDSQIT